MEPIKKQAKVKKKVVLNPDGDQVIIDPEKAQDVKEATAVLTIQQRRQRAISIRRRMPKIKRARELAVKRLAGTSKIKKRSRNLARKFLKRRFAGTMGSSYQSLSASQKMTVDRIVSTKGSASRAIASRLVPRVRSAEFKRVSSGKRSSTYSMRPITSSVQHPDLPLIEAAKVCVETLVNEVKMQGKDPCWKGYEMVGQKKKNGKKVPNCVPVGENAVKPPVGRLLRIIEARKKSVSQ